MHCLVVLPHVCPVPPASYSPGWFDIVGASHQWWHVLALAGFLWWYTSCKEMLAILQAEPCPAAAVWHAVS